MGCFSSNAPITGPPGCWYISSPGGSRNHTSAPDGVLVAVAVAVAVAVGSGVFVGVGPGVAVAVEEGVTVGVGGTIGSSCSTKIWLTFNVTGWFSPSTMAFCSAIVSS